jgi:hypothetical protein
MSKQKPELHPESAEEDMSQHQATQYSQVALKRSNGSHKAE